MAKLDIDAALADHQSNVDEAIATATSRESGAALPSPLQGAVTALQGPLFGFLDEITGAIQGAKSVATGGDFAPAYREGRDLIRGMESQYQRDYPTTATASKLMASAPVFVGGPQVLIKPVAGASSFANLMRQMAGAGATAAGYGALTAAGESESQDRPLLMDVLTGGASSAATAGASVPVVNILAGITGRAGRALPVSPSTVSAVVPDALKPAGVSSSDFATRKVAEQLIRDQPTTANIRDPLGRALAYLRWMGKDARLVDVGGTQTHRTFDTLATLPGRTPEAAAVAVMERQAGRGAAIMREADKALGTRGAQFRQTVAELESAAAANAKPFYDQIRDVQLPVSGELRDVLQLANRHLAGADEYAASLGITGRGLREALVGTPVVGVSGNRVTTAVAPLSRFDALKQYLYDVEQKYLRDGSKNQAAAITAIRRRLIDELDKLSPKDAAGNSIYKMARDAYAGPSQLKDAAEVGRKAFAPDNDFAIREAIEGMSQSEIMAMRVGLMQAVREKAGTQAGQNWLMNNWKNPAVREKVQFAFGKDAGKFLDALNKQSKMKVLEAHIGGGSQTGSRAANADDLGVEAVQEAAAGAAAAKTGDVAGAMSWIAKLKAHTELPEPVRNEMGRIMLLKGDAAKAKLKEMAGLLDLIARQQAKQAATTGAFVGRQNPWLTGGNATNGDQ